MKDALQLSVLTLVRATSRQQLDHFVEAIWKFHMRCQYRGTMRHILVDASPPKLSREFEESIAALRSSCAIEIHPSHGSIVEDYNFGFSLIDTRYALFFFPDHVLEIQPDDFLSDCALSLERNPDVYQVHLSGPYTEWTVEKKLLSDVTFKEYIAEHNPHRLPYYPWLRLDDDHLWYGGRMLYLKGIPGPGNPLVRRVVDPGRVTLWVSPSQPPGTPIRSQGRFIQGGGVKHLALAFNGAPSFYNMELFRPYLPAPTSGGSMASIGELYFYRDTDLDQKYGIGWLNAQTFFWHRDYGWSLEDEQSRMLFREILLNTKQL